ncbi:MFS transporter [Candidatus Nitrosacidococcus tergens]|uniref:Putative Multidrug resistance protein B n=1 Tax=Candidatus Nitrosacidococcus tergens TaxID=553981 RepID=A0A7G1QB37_9GAMM|nr:MFS transporter [Candidatus Nitrosacidococcus tergens]CAB1276432.1 putative Multidrug resistance protein B [Candidatus Nitrosacidococcus tergens]
MAKLTAIFSRRLRGWRFVLFNFALGLGNISAAFMAPTYLAIEPHTAGDLEGTFVSFVIWSQTYFFLAMTLGFPVGRVLAERYGNYRVYIVSMLILAVACYFCAISPGYLEFMYSRILLGLCAGISLLLGQELMLNEYPARSKITGVIIWGILSVMLFGMGPPIGGWLADEVNWRYLFYINGFIALIPAGLIGALLYDRGFHRVYRPFDFVGFLLFAALAYGIQALINMGNDFDWFESPFLRRVLLLTLIIFPYFIIWTSGQRHPLIDLSLFKRRTFVIGLIGVSIGFFAAQGLFSYLTLRLQTIMGYTSTLAGQEIFPLLLLTVPAAVGVALFSKYVDPRLLASLSLLGFAATCYWLGMYDQPGWYEQTFWPVFFMGIFFFSYMGPLTAIALRGLSNVQLIRAAETINMFRIAFGGLGIVSDGIIEYRRTPYHQLHLANHFGGRQYASYDVLEQFSEKLDKLGLDQVSIIARAGRLIHEEAGVLTVADAFLLGSFTLLGLATLVWFVPANKPPIIPPTPIQEELLEEKIETAEVTD